LTHDIEIFDIHSETRMTTSNFEDVFAVKPRKGVFSVRNTNSPELENVESTENDEESPAVLKSLTRRQTFPAIDNTAGTYRSKALIVTLWASYIVTYFAFYSGDIDATVCEVTNGTDTSMYTFQYGRSWSDSSDAIGCAIGESVFRWLARFVVSSSLGLTTIALGSLGNDLECTRVYLPSIAIISMVLNWYAVCTGRIGNSNELFLQVVSLVLISVAIIVQLVHICTLLIPSHYYQRVPMLKRLFTAQTVVRAADLKKAAAFKTKEMVRNAIHVVRKQQKGSVLETHFGQALMVFSKEQKTKYVGGIKWTWQRIYNGQIFQQDGIWLSARLVSSNMTQVIVTVFVLIAGIRLTYIAANEYDPETAKDYVNYYAGLIFDATIESEDVAVLVANVSTYFSEFVAEGTLAESFVAQNCGVEEFVQPSLIELGRNACTLGEIFYQCDDLSSTADYFCSLASNNATELLLNNTSQTIENELLNLGMLNASGLDVDSLVNIVRASLQQAAESSVDSIYPTAAYMVYIPFAVATCIAFITAVSLALTYIPSVTSTTLKLRYGLIPSLQDKEFNKYRVAADSVTIITGSMFWGCLLASILVGGIIGTIVFVCIWQATVALVQQLVATLIGIIVVLLIKIIMVNLCRCTFYKAFYRKHPAAANLSNLALECANFALSVGFVALRMIKLLLASALYVGRIDTYFLAPGIGRIGPLQLDGYPQIFLRAILSHESHRHPYIDSLGIQCLMKLRYGEGFGKRAGAAWRLLFVYALMPWLHKYRIRETQDDVESHRESVTLVVENLRPSWRKTPKVGGVSTTRFLKDKLGGSIVQLHEEKMELVDKVESLQNEVDRLKKLLVGIDHGPLDESKIKSEEDKSIVSQNEEDQSK